MFHVERLFINIGLQLQEIWLTSYRYPVGQLELVHQLTDFQININFLNCVAVIGNK